MQDLLKVINNDIYIFFVYLTSFSRYLDLFNDVCTNHCKLLENHVYQFGIIKQNLFKLQDQLSFKNKNIYTWFSNNLQ